MPPLHTHTHTHIFLKFSFDLSSSNPFPCNVHALVLGISSVFRDALVNLSAQAVTVAEMGNAWMGDSTLQGSCDFSS